MSAAVAVGDPGLHARQAMAALPMTRASSARDSGYPEVGARDTEARDTGAVVVDIYDQIYQLSGTDPEQIERLAAMVDDKMRIVSQHGATVDSLRVAVLAALNIADELLTLRESYARLAGSADVAMSTTRSRAGSLLGMLDEVLDERPAERRVS